MIIYEIRVKGHLDRHWSEWFEGLEITNLENGEAVLSGEIVVPALVVAADRPMLGVFATCACYR